MTQKDTIKDFLSRPMVLWRRVDRMKDRYAFMKEQAEGLQGIDYSKVAVEGGQKVPALEQAAVNLVAFSEEIARQTAKASAAEFEVNRLISDVEDVCRVYGEVLFCRHISCLSWSDISLRMGYSRQQVWRMYQAALVVAGEKIGGLKND